MGFLDNSTNNIILDAVLTDYGREALAANNQSFMFDRFALADDEVDYSIIEKYGRTVGKEKISKNTPVFEAQTRGSLALRHKLITLQEASLFRLPSYSFETNVTSITLSPSSTSATPNFGTVVLKQTILNQAGISSELNDGFIDISMQSRFIYMAGQSPNYIDTAGVAYYSVPSVNTTSQGGSQIRITINVRALTATTFSIYGNYTDKNTIVTHVNFAGRSSGGTKTLQVNINKT